MTIAEVSEKYDISQDTLRYYERIGLIPPVNRNKNGNRIIRKKTVNGWNLSNVCGMQVFRLKC
jgi:DNA-binding transcriptional MerR regulator